MDAILTYPNTEDRGLLTKESLFRVEVHEAKGFYAKYRVPLARDYQHT